MSEGSSPSGSNSEEDLVLETLHAVAIEATRGGYLAICEDCHWRGPKATSQKEAEDSATTHAPGAPRLTRAEDVAQAAGPARRDPGARLVTRPGSGEPVEPRACGCASHPAGHRFYTSVRRTSARFGVQHVALSGPYATHEEALEALDADRRWARDADPRACFYSYGTFSAGPDVAIKTARPPA